MISEIDIRDWDRVDIKKAKEVVNDLDDFARMANIVPTGAINFFEDFFKQIELIRNKQINEAKRKIPAILRKGEE